MREPESAHPDSPGVPSGGAAAWSADHSFARAVLLVGLLALIPFFLVLVWPSGDLLRNEPLGGFYEAQAHALLEGHWYVNPGVAGVEGYDVKGHTQIYFGPVPAVVRMPLVAVTSKFDGRLTRVSLLLAELLLIVSLARLTVWTRRLLQPDEPPTRLLLVLSAGNVVAIGTSVPLLLTSNTWVYHEAILWGAAQALAAFWLLVAHLVTRRRAPLVGAAVLAGLAALTRASVGLGPLVALGLLAGVRLWSHLRARRAESATVDSSRAARSTLVVAAVAIVVTGSLYVTVNESRFGTPLRVPYEHQRITGASVARQRALAANGNSLTGLSYAPTQLLQAVRPDALRISSTLPFVHFPDGQATAIGNATFEDRSATVSLPVSAPLPAVLGVFGIAVIASGRRRFRKLGSRRRSLWIVYVGAAAGTLGVLTFADISDRYLGDALPLLGVTSVVGAIGLASLARSRSDETERLASDGAPTRGRSRLAMGVTAGATAFAVLAGTWINAGLAADYRYDHGLTQPFTDVRTWSTLQFEVAQHLHGNVAPSWLVRLADLRAAAPDGTVAVLRDCTGVYRYSGGAWTVIEGHPLTTEALVTSPPRPTSATATELVHIVGATGITAVVLEPVGRSHARVVVTFRGTGPNAAMRLDFPGLTVTWTASHRPTLHVLLDPATGSAQILRGDTVMVSAGAPIPATGMRASSSAVVVRPPSTDLCVRLDQALRRSGR